MERQAVFLKEDVQKLLRNKFIVILGDSVQRTIYKDLTVLLQENRFLNNSELRQKGELSFSQDRLLEGGKMGELHNGINYREVRQYQTDYHLLRFYFLTRVYGKYVETVLSDLMEGPEPDVVIMNSCLWDITRYGPMSITTYKNNLEKLFKRLKATLPAHSMVLWNTTLPVSSNIRGGFMVPEVAFMNDTLRLDILEANYYARDTVASFGYDVLDLHYYFRWQLHRRAKDGVHWNEKAHRRITNLVLAHLANAWGVGVPRLIAPDQSVEHAVRRSRHVRSQSATQLDWRSYSNISTHTEGNGGPYKQPVSQTMWQRTKQQINDYIRSQCTNYPRTVEERYGGPVKRSTYQSSAMYMSPHTAAYKQPLLADYSMLPLPYLDFSQPYPSIALNSAFSVSPQNLPSEYGKIASQVNQKRSTSRYNPYSGLSGGRNRQEKVAKDREQELRNQ
ncbi:PC-esterase domain-containing protein 1A-like [Ptychodera flava]|uniref:PC-esterase domain-containing protein 1A-like n=1 Tax=Ptychodera flava TaxID=63121 RepID=UPI00396A45FD